MAVPSKFGTSRIAQDNTHLGEVQVTLLKKLSVSGCFAYVYEQQIYLFGHF